MQIERFKNNYNIYLADTQESKNINYSIRHTVYCETVGFENQNLDKLEYDKSDDNSTHFIVQDKKSKEWVGAMRLIHPIDGVLPVMKMCDIQDNSDMDMVVEISRLCVIKGLISKSNNRLVMWGLIFAANDYCKMNKISIWYFMITHSLSKLLKTGSLELYPIGNPCYHRGNRFPFKLNILESYLNSSDVKSYDIYSQKDKLCLKNL